jgi:cell division septum initiation protein DivIVA
MNIEEILIAMEDLLEDAWNLPMSGGKRVVSATELLDLITDLRSALPEEIRECRELLAKRDQIILKGREEAQLAIETARAQANKMVSKEAVLVEAQHEAQRVINQAQEKAKEMRAATVEYCDSILGRTSELLTKSTQAVEETRKTIKKPKENKEA